MRPVEDLRRVAPRVVQFEQAKHASLCSLGIGCNLERNCGAFELSRHLVELQRSRHTPADVGQIVSAVGVQHKAVVPFVHPQIAPIRFALVDDLHTKDAAGVIAPGIQIRNRQA